MLKMNTLLAKVEHGAAQFNRMIGDYFAFFKNKQGMFEGIKKTFKPREGYQEDARYMGTTKVATTVDEKLQWFEENAVPYLKNLFSIESTNSKGAKKVELKVGNISFGFLTALDLMRLKTVLTKKEWEEMYNNIPVRSDAEVWEPCTDGEYAGREIFQTPMQTGVTRTTESEEVILKDTGAWTQRQRAELLRRRSQLLAAVIEALKEVNDVESEDPNLDVEGLINFLHHGE